MANKSKSKSTIASNKVAGDTKSENGGGPTKEAAVNETPVLEQTTQGEDAVVGEVAAKNPAASDITLSGDDLSAALTATAGASVVGTDDDALEGGASSEGDLPTLAVVVIGPKQGRWRAGRHFSQEPTMIPVAELTDEHAKQIKDDPLLAVSFIDLRDAQD